MGSVVVVVGALVVVDGVASEDERWPPDVEDGSVVVVVGAAVVVVAGSITCAVAAGFAVAANTPTRAADETLEPSRTPRVMRRTRA